MASPSTDDGPIEPAAEPELSAEEAHWIAKRARVELAKQDFSLFVRQAIAAGVVHGISKVQWGQHLQGFCFATQMQLEAWLVCYGYGTEEMIARQREAWERTGAVWEDGEPEPWLRYPLVQNEVDNLPPGTLKSTIGMVLANAWIWLWCATYAFGAASGIDANVARDSDATREIIRSLWYREYFQIAHEDLDAIVDAGEPTTELELNEEEKHDPIAIDARHDAISDWKTTFGGRRYSRTINRGFTGLHVDGEFIDDPDDADRVFNEAARVRPQNRFTRAIENRVNDERRSIRKVMQQVVHVAGFTAYLTSIARWSPQNPKGWAQFCLPAEYGFGPEDAPKETPYGWKDWRTVVGETLHPMLSPGVLADKRLKLPGYEGQYNQNASRAANGIFERRHARFFIFEGENPALLRRRPNGCPGRDEQPPIVVKLSELRSITLSIDAANSLDPKPGAKVSAVGMTVNARGAGDDRYTLDDRTKVLGVSGTYRAIYAAIRAWQLDALLVEMKALGAAVVDEIERAIRRGWYIDPDDNTGTKIELVGPDGKRTRPDVIRYNPGKNSKPQRAHGMLPTWESGMWFLHDGAAWLYPQVDENRKTVDEGLIGELCSFDGTSAGSIRSDRVDTLSQYHAQHRTATDARERFRILASR